MHKYLAMLHVEDKKNKKFGTQHPQIKPINCLLGMSKALKEEGFKGQTNYVQWELN